MPPACERAGRTFCYASGMTTQDAAVNDLAQTIADNLHALAESVRSDPQEARSMIGVAESVVSDLRELYELVGEP